MRHIQDTFETLKRSFISVFSICMTVPLIVITKLCRYQQWRQHRYRHLNINIVFDII